MSEIIQNLNLQKTIDIKNENHEENKKKEINLYAEKEKDSNENLEDEIEKEHQKFLNNPQTFQRKRDFFSFYSKYRNAAQPSSGNSINQLKHKHLNAEIIIENAEYKEFNPNELIPRGFGISKVKEKIEFFEKSMLIKEYPIKHLNDCKTKIYEKKELRVFDINYFKPESIQMASFNYVNKKEENKIVIKNKDNNIDYKVDKNKENKILNDIDNNFDKNKDNNIDNNINIINNININIIGKEKENEKNDNNNNNIKKTRINPVIDYSKIINSSKLNKKPKEFDYFLKSKMEKKNIIRNKDNNNVNIINDAKKEKKGELFLSFSSYREGEVSTSFSHVLNLDKKLNTKDNRQNSDICCYKELLSKIKKQEQISGLNPKLNNIVKEFQLSTANKEIKNNKYILVRNKHNKISVEKKQKFKNDDVKVLHYEKIPDNMALDRFDKAKYKLNKINNNNLIKNQIYEVLDKLVIDDADIKKENDKQKLIRVTEIMKLLLIIKQKITTLSMNNGYMNNYNLKNLDKKKIKTSVSSLYFIKCIGLEPNILFGDKEKMKNVKFINDVKENIQLNGLFNKKRYLKYYFRNINRAGLLLGILINNINKLKPNKNIEINS